MKIDKLFDVSPALVFVFTSFAFQSWAESGAAAGRSNPAVATAQVPRADYRSPFAVYHAFQEQEIGDWRRSNDTAGTIGGWRAYARESTPAPSGGGAIAGSSGSGSRTGAADPHAGHAQAPQQQPAPGGAAKPPSSAAPPGKPPAMQHDLKEKMQGMSPEMQQKMKEKMQGMSPEMQQKMKEKMQGMSPEMQQKMKEKMQGKPGAAKDDPAMRGAVPPAPKDPNDAHQHH